ncbi:hypothetical protein [Empedobacter brevis]|uniref:hypothetical protein n=1 Tax=Empedobacter brevis TaxID=247 RepID=UPI0039AEC043
MNSSKYDNFKNSNLFYLINHSRMKYIYLFVFYFCSLFTFAQSKLETAIKSLETNYAQEKVYLLFDKEDYIAGDNIWFKAYTLNGYKPSLISTNLIVELYDKDKKLVDRKLVPIVNGESDGTLNTKNENEEGIYFVRAYTTYMTFFPEEFQYINQLKIYNPTSKLKLVPNPNLKWNAKAFAEGGNFIQNQTTKFAIRLKFDGELPKKWNGFVFEKNNPSNKIATFENLDENVATFSLRAEEGKLYQVQLNDEKGNQQIIDLPEAKKAGVLLKVVRNSKDIAIQLKSINQENPLLNYKIIGTINNELVMSSQIVKSVESVSTYVPKEVLDNDKGVLNIAIFDANDIQVANRLIFIHPKELYKKPEVAFETTTNPRELNTIKLKYPEEINFSTVIKDQKNPDEDNLISAMLLTRDFSSKISYPTQYFKNNKFSENLDALLISEKWRRFNWEDLVVGNVVKPTIDNNRRYLSYKIKAYNNGRELSDASLSIIYKMQNNGKEFATLDTNYEGDFEMNNLFYYGPMAMNYFLNSENGKQANNGTLTLSVVPNYKSTSYKSKLPATSYLLEEITNKEEIEKQNTYKENIKIINDKSIRLKEVVVKADKKSKTEQLNNELSTGMFQSINETIIDFVNESQPIEGYTNIADFLAGRVAGLTVSNGVPKIRNSDVAIYWNEMKVSSDNLNSINVRDIAMVKIFKGNGLLGNAIAIYSKRGKEATIDNTPMLPNNLIQLGGYNQSLPYFSLDDYESLYNAVPNDIRSTLFWNPNLYSEPGENTELEYFNNDKPKDYQLTIIGFDEKGNPVYYEGKIN